MASSDEQSVSSTPEVPSVSPGSSVSTALKEEYEDLLKYALVTPVLEPSMGGRATLRRPDASMTGASAVDSFRLPNSTLHTNLNVTEGTVEPHTLACIVPLSVSADMIMSVYSVIAQGRVSLPTCVCIKYMCVSVCVCVCVCLPIVLQL